MKEGEQWSCQRACTPRLLWYACSMTVVWLWYDCGMSVGGPFAWPPRLRDVTFDPMTSCSTTFQSDDSILSTPPGTRPPWSNQTLYTGRAVLGTNLMTKAKSVYLFVCCILVYWWKLIVIVYRHETDLLTFGSNYAFTTACFYYGLFLLWFCNTSNM